MLIRRLRVQSFRRFEDVELLPEPGFNLLTGDNGSGKTTVLEALHLLAHGRSFRGRVRDGLIRRNDPALSVFVEWQAGAGHVHRAGLRHAGADWEARLDEAAVSHLGELCEALAVVSFEPGSHALIDGSSEGRRRYLDWGVFHVEPRFLQAWQRLQKALRQRNSWLRHGKLDAASQAAWDRELCLASDELDGYRRAYIQALKPVFEQVLGELVEIEGLTLSYYRGWDKDKSLADVLAATLPRDQQLGHTQAGPQRADLRLRLGVNNAAEILSRGQQKLVVCALRIAQGHLLNQAKQGQCIYLVDDLPSELDEQHRQALCRLLDDLQCQVFITCVDHEYLKDGWRTDTPVAMFHVEHGVITASGVNA